MSLHQREKFAKALLAMGLPVIPLAPRSKHPIRAWIEFQKRLPTEREVFEAIPPDSNFGIIMGRISGFCVVDFDSEESLAWGKANLPETPMKTTTASGQHWFYRIPKDVKVGNKVKLQIAGKKYDIDLRGEGSYVVAPYSIHPSGQEYKIEQEWPSSFDSVPYFPEQLLRKTEFSDSRLLLSNLERARIYAAGAPAAIEGDGGDSVTFKVAVKLVRDFGLEIDVAQSVLEENWNKRCVPPWNSDSLRGKLENALCYGKSPIGVLNDDPVEWEDPVTLDEFDLPEFPRDVFPRDLEQFLRDLSVASETPYDMCALVCLAAISTAIRGQYSIRVKDSFCEPAPLWVLILLPPGNRKSFVFKILTKPIYEFERQLQETKRDQIRKNETLNKNIDTQIAKLRRQLGDSKKNDPQKIFSQIEELEKTKPAKIPYPKLVISDVTPEKVASVMSENDETIALLDDEGGFFETMGGRYNKGRANFDIYLKGYSSSPVRVDRQHSAEPLQLDQPCLTIGATVQPSVLLSMSERPEFKSRGLLSRFIFAVPKSPLGTRTGNTTDISAAAIKKFDELLNAILNSSGGGF